MSEPEEKVNISALKDTFLECPVCVEHFNQTDRRPRLLHSCLHAFCTQCLQQLLDKEGKGQITCPLCRQVQRVFGKPDTLPVDLVRAKLVDFVQIKNEGKAPCTDCPEGSTAESRCQECSVYLCKECAYVHRRHRLTHDHPIISLSGVLEQPLNTFAKGHFCIHHPKHQVEFFCASDETLCCLSCTVVEHKGHDFQKLDEAATKRQTELEASMRAVNINAQQLRQRRLIEERRQTAIAEAQAKAKSDVDKYFTRLISIINERKSHLVGDIDERSSAMLSLSEKEVEAIDQTLAVAESTETYFTQAKEKADVVEILQMYPAIKRSLDAAADGQGKYGLTAPEVVTFTPTNGNIVEKLGSEVGCVSESADTQNENDQLLQCLDEVFDAALKYKTKKKLINHFEKKSYSNERETCAICENYIVDAMKIPCGHCFCKSCIIDQGYGTQRNCPVCNTNSDRSVYEGDDDWQSVFASATAVTAASFPMLYPEGKANRKNKKIHAKNLSTCYGDDDWQSVFASATAVTAASFPMLYPEGKVNRKNKKIHAKNLSTCYGDDDWQSVFASATAVTAASFPNVFASATAVTTASYPNVFASATAVTTASYPNVFASATAVTTASYPMLYPEGKVNRKNKKIHAKNLSTCYGDDDWQSVFASATAVTTASYPSVFASATAVTTASYPSVFASATAVTTASYPMLYPEGKANRKNKKIHAKNLSTCYGDDDWQMPPS